MSTETTQRFWIVLADVHHMQATMRHPNRELAKAEAMRLAALNHGVKFFVACITGAAQFPQPLPPQPEWTELKKPYDGWRGHNAD